MTPSMTQTGPEDVAAHYDALDRFYREIWGEHVHHGLWETGQESTEEAILHLSRRIAALAHIQAGDHVIDVGCGYGGTSRLLAREYGASVTGVTVSRQQYNYAKKQVNDGEALEFKCQDFLGLNMATESCQALISIECIEHMQDKTAFLRKAHRLLRPGGRFAFALWTTASDAKAWQKNSLLRPICEEGRMPELLTIEDWVRSIEAAGLVVTYRQDVAQLVKKTWAICCRRFLGKLMTDPGYWKFLWLDATREKIFALTIFRLYLAYQTKALGYWLIAGQKPA